MKKKRWIIIGVVLLVAVIGVAAAAEYGKYRMGLIPEMSFEEVLNYTTRDNPDASIDQYLELPPDQHYPTIKQLMTHKAGYKGYYFETGSRMSDGNGDLGNYWDWMPGDTYMAAGAVLSNIEDMLAYAQMQLEETHNFDLCHQSLYQIDASSESYKTMGIYMDEVAYAWMIDTHNGIIWHNGGTGDD